MIGLAKGLVISTGIIITIILGLFLYIHIAFDGIFTGPFYNHQDLIENYELRKSELLDVTDYFLSIVPEHSSVTIEFADDEIEIFHLGKGGVYDSNWNLERHSHKTDSLLAELGWTQSTLDELENKLDKANCIYASSRYPTTIGWQRSGMGMFFYKIFNENLNDSLVSQYNDSCMYIYYKDNIVLEYGGGAIGPQCFPGYKRRPK
ncbi:hypothetical protein [uncultured Imperialibacter sp.]|uniref:hypothetical protein n=1 Tax=uncultured Imperialibacter sp. TaxID=1672639 RepID=UPI0030D7E07F|tara:strand:- start:193 stop:807 length:615 start_codon:yes stop_codon:yes gene_type:complete